MIYPTAAFQRWETAVAHRYSALQVKQDTFSLWDTITWVGLSALNVLLTATSSFYRTQKRIAMSQYLASAPCLPSDLDALHRLSELTRTMKTQTDHYSNPGS